MKESNLSLLRLAAEIWRFKKQLSQRTLRYYYALFFLILLNGLAEAVSLGAVVPFLAVLVAPDTISNHSYFLNLLNFFGLSQGNDPTNLVSILFLSLALCAGVVRVSLVWATNSLAFKTGNEISVAAFRSVLTEDYLTHIGRNSSEVVTSVLHRVNGVVFWILLPLLTITSSLVLACAMTIALIIINPLIALVTISFVFLSYGLLVALTRQTLLRNGEVINAEQNHVIKVLQESLGSVREVIISGKYEHFVDKYKLADKRLRDAYKDNNIIGGFPRPVMETFGILLIASIAIAFQKLVGDLVDVIPVLAAFILCAQRLLPAIQQSFAGWSNIVSGYPALVDVVSQLERLDERPLKNNEDTFKEGVKNSICLSNVSFKYPTGDSVTLSGVDICFDKGKVYGFVGASGSGKSTLIDLLMGILPPSSGSLVVDNVQVNATNLVSWRKQVTIVPQTVVLLDATIAENVAFGVSKEAIDYEKVKEVCDLAKISDYVEASSDGYFSIVGERGVRISGGERQRIGLARALYNLRPVLILDEATSSLDAETERLVMNALNSLSEQPTVFMIAHRLSTLAECDEIIRVDDGKIVRVMSYEELKSTEEEVILRNAK